MTLFKLNCFFKGPVSSYSHIGGYGFNIRIIGDKIQSIVSILPSSVKMCLVRILIAFPFHEIPHWSITSDLVR